MIYDQICLVAIVVVVAVVETHNCASLPLSSPRRRVAVVETHNCASLHCRPPVGVLRS